MAINQLSVRPRKRSAMTTAVHKSTGKNPNSKYYSKFKPEYLKRRNAARKKAYGTNPSYRRQAQSWSRNAYRKHHGVIFRDCAENVGQEKSFATVREVLWKGQLKQMLCLSSQEMATLLGGYSIQNFYQWLAKKLLPRPVLVVNRTKQPLNVYTVQEAKVIALIISEHQRTKAYLTAKDTSTVRSLFNMVNAVRRKIGLPQTTTLNENAATN